MGNNTPKGNLGTVCESSTAKTSELTEKCQERSRYTACCQQFLSRPCLRHVSVKKQYNYNYSRIDDAIICAFKFVGEHSTHG